MQNQEQTATPSVALEQLAAQYGFTPEAVQTLWQALLSGGGTMAQFSHPELGGTGQWTKGGMIMIGDMSNNALKDRVDGLCSELAKLLEKQPPQEKIRPFAAGTESDSDNWWGADLGASAAGGSQNNTRYAYFPATRRLAILQDQQVTMYDTGSHHITGISQEQSATGSLTFTTPSGTVRPTDLSVISTHSADR